MGEVESRCGRRSCGPQGRTATTRRQTTVLTGLRQLDGLGTATGRASTSAGEHYRNVKVRVVGLGLLLGPAPLTQGTLVNEGEGTNFVCHICIRCRIGQKVKLRKYRDSHSYAARPVSPLHPQLSSVPQVRVRSLDANLGPAVSLRSNASYPGAPFRRAVKSCPAHPFRGRPLRPQKILSSPQNASILRILLNPRPI
jgi:hypothetical protein